MRIGGIAALSPAARGHLAMVVFAASISGSISLGARIANLVDPTVITAVRFLGAAAIMLAATALGPGLRRAHLVQPWRHFVLGGLMAAYFVFMFEGLKTAPAVGAAAIFTLMPVMTAGFGWLIAGQFTTRRMAGAIAVGAGGALWVIFRGDPSALASLAIGRGEAIYFAGCVAHAVFIPLARRLNRGEPPEVVTLLFLLAGAGLLFVWGWSAIAATAWAQLPAVVWVTLAYITVMASALSFFLLQYATMRLPAAKVMGYSYLTPASVLVWEIALGGTLPPALTLVGVGLTLVALGLLLKDEERPARTDAALALDRAGRLGYQEPRAQNPGNRP